MVRCGSGCRRGGLRRFHRRRFGAGHGFDRRRARRRELTTLLFDDVRRRYELAAQLRGARGFASGQRVGVAMRCPQVLQFALQGVDPLRGSGDQRLQLVPPVVTVGDVSAQARDFLAQRPPRVWVRCGVRRDRLRRHCGEVGFCGRSGRAQRGVLGA